MAVLVFDIAELFRREVLKAFVRQELISKDVAQNMLAWPHSGFNVHISPRLHADEKDSLQATVRYAARAPIALNRLHYDRETQTVAYSYTSAYDHRDQTERISPRELIARLASHIPDRHERLLRYSGHYSNRSRGARRASTPAVGTGAVEEKPPHTQWRRQWQQLLQRVFNVTLTCPTCGTEMKIIAVITQNEPIHKILDHLKSRKIDPRAGPFSDMAA